MYKKLFLVFGIVFCSMWSLEAMQQGNLDNISSKKDQSACDDISKSNTTRAEHKPVTTDQQGQHQTISFSEHITGFFTNPVAMVSLSAISCFLAFVVKKPIVSVITVALCVLASYALYKNYTKENPAPENVLRDYIDQHVDELGVQVQQELNRNTGTPLLRRELNNDVTLMQVKVLNQFRSIPVTVLPYDECSINIAGLGGSCGFQSIKNIREIKRILATNPVNIEQALQNNQANFFNLESTAELFGSALGNYLLKKVYPDLPQEGSWRRLMKEHRGNQSNESGDWHEKDDLNWLIMKIQEQNNHWQHDVGIIDIFDAYEIAGNDWAPGINNTFTAIKTNLQNNNNITQSFILMISHKQESSSVQHWISLVVHKVNGHRYYIIADSANSYNNQIFAQPDKNRLHDRYVLQFISHLEENIQPEDQVQTN